MNEHYPRIRIRAETGNLAIRESLSCCFYMRRSHSEVVDAVHGALEIYLRAVGPRVLDLYADHEGEWQNLDETGWALIQRELRSERWPRVHLASASRREERYQFNYIGKSLEHPSPANTPTAVCAVSFWLPTEYLETNGPAHVRALALELAALLPFCSGHAGLSFEAEPMLGTFRAVRERCFRYPGLDIPELSRLARKVGTRLRGPSWLTFLGQPVLGELGGAAALRARLRSPGTTVENLDAQRAVVTLGEWPEAGDTEQGRNLPAYRELAGAIEPWLYHGETGLTLDFPLEDLRRWERRFLD